MARSDRGVYCVETSPGDLTLPPKGAWWLRQLHWLFQERGTATQPAAAASPQRRTDSVMLTAELAHLLAPFYPAGISSML